RSLQTRGFASGMEARQGGDSFAGSVHDSQPRQGDARERHKQENNKTDNNQGSSNQSQNRRKKRIITGKVMSFLTTGHKQRRRGKRTGAAGARSSPFLKGNDLPEVRLFMPVQHQQGERGYRRTSSPFIKALQ
ncbi:hypothetical protein ACFLQD_005477, partial [Escherichia coli]